MAEAFAGKYLSLTSFKRDGKSVATPVWFVQENGRLFVRTGAESGKVKRIRRDQSVTVALCTPSGGSAASPSARVPRSCLSARRNMSMS